MASMVKELSYKSFHILFIRLLYYLKGYCKTLIACLCTPFMAKEISYKIIHILFITMETVAGNW